MPDLLIATTNAQKREEIATVFSAVQHNFSLLTLNDLPLIEGPDEPWELLTANALFKAQHYGLASQHLTLSDDSGLFVDALNGFPGVRTREYATQCGSMSQTFRNLKTLLHGLPTGATFICAMAMYDPTRGGSHEGQWVVQASVRGTLCFDSPLCDSSDNQHGYDPIFIPENHSNNFVDLGSTIKNQISHRAKALNKILSLYMQRT